MWRKVLDASSSHPLGFTFQRSRCRTIRADTADRVRGVVGKGMAPHETKGKKNDDYPQELSTPESIWVKEYTSNIEKRERYTEEEVVEAL